MKILIGIGTTKAISIILFYLNSTVKQQVIVVLISLNILQRKEIRYKKMTDW